MNYEKFRARITKRATDLEEKELALQELGKLVEYLEEYCRDCKKAVRYAIDNKDNIDQQWAAARQIDEALDGVGYTVRQMSEASNHIVADIADEGE